MTFDEWLESTGIHPDRLERKLANRAWDAARALRPKAALPEWNDALEAAAKLCESHDEGSSSFGNRVLIPKTSTNINGTGYAREIRALKRHGPQDDSRNT